MSPNNLLTLTSPEVLEPTGSQNLAMYRQLFEISNDLLCIASLDGYFQKVNPAFVRVLGYSEVELRQRAFLEFVHPEDTERTIQAMESLKAQVAIHGFTNRYRCSNGSYRWLTWQSQPIEGTELVYASAHDVTAQREAEQALARREEQFRLLAENMADIVTLHQPDGTIDYASPSVEKILGYTPQELVGQDPYRYFHPDDIAYIREESHQQLLSQSLSSYTIEYRIRRKDGAYIWFETTSDTVVDDQQQVIAIVTNSRDISDRKKEEQRTQQLNERLRMSNEELENFAYMASHDLQEPLRVVASYLQVLQRRYQPQLDERASQFIDYAVDGATRMKQLITDLLDYSRVNNLFQERQWVDLNQIMARAELDLQQRLRQTGATLHYSSLPKVYANETLMYRVFMNLISNAIKFRSEQPPAISIEVKERAKCWQFSVADNGIGINPKYVHHIFEIFRRLNGHKYEGTGMGLAIVKKIIENHRGTIDLQSQEGRGTTFYFTLPIRPNDDCSTESV